MLRAWVFAGRETYSLGTSLEEENGLVKPFLACFEVRHYDCPLTIGVGRSGLRDSEGSFLEV